MNTVSYFIGEGPRLKVNKTVRQPGSSPKQRKAEQAIRDNTKRRMDDLWRATRGKGWSYWHCQLAQIIWDRQARNISRLTSL